MTDPNASASASAPKEKSSVFDDLVEITFSPRQVFTRRATAGFGATFFIVWILMSGIAFASRPVYEAAMQAQIDKAKAKMAEANTSLTPDQQATAEKISGFVAQAAIVIGPPIAMLVLGLFVWLVGKIFGGAINAGQGMLIATLAFVPRFLGSLAVLALSFVMDSSNATDMAQLSLGPARFLDPVATGAPLMAMLSRIDVAVIWGTAIIAIGYATIGKMSKEKAWGAAIVLWILGALPALLGAMRS